MKAFISLCLGSTALLAACGGSDEAATTTVPGADTRVEPTLVSLAYRFTEDSPEQTIWVENQDGRAIFQGDIDLGPIEQLTRRTALTVGKVRPEGIVRTGVARWDNNAVVVVDDSALPSDYRTTWQAGMKLIMANTPVRFTRDKDYYKRTIYTGSYPTTTYDYVALSWQESNPNFAGQSQVGRIGGGQPLTLTRAADSAVVAHELMHALGIWHEQSRPDRNNYITVNYSNIQPSQSSQFDIHAQDGSTAGQYDYCSVMHYGRYFSSAFAINPSVPLIVPKVSFSCFVVNPAGSWQSVTDIGQRWGLSQIDIDTIRSLQATAPAGKPFAHAGANQSVSTSSPSVTISLNGSGSYHPINGSSIATYSWVPVGWSPDCYKPYFGYQCPGNPIVNANSAQATVTIATPASSPYSGPKVTTHQFRLTVTDTTGRSMSDVVTVTTTRY